MHHGLIHKQVASIIRIITVVTNFRKNAEMPSKSFGFVLSLDEFNPIKKLQAILAKISSQSYQYFLIFMVAFK